MPAERAGVVETPGEGGGGRGGGAQHKDKIMFFGGIDGLLTLGSSATRLLDRLAIGVEKTPPHSIVRGFRQVHSRGC